MHVIPTFLLGRWSAPDVIAALRPKVVPPTLPEYDDKPEETPMQCLEREVGFMSLNIYDYRDLAAWPRDKVYDPKHWGWPKNKRRGDAVGTRPWEQITATMLHTTAVAGMGHNRFLGVPCHIGIADNGDVVLCHELWRYVHHGNHGNSFSVGIEISGRSDWECEAQIHTTRAVIRYVQAVRDRNVAEHLRRPMAIMAHRMTRAGKPNDCGAPIWRDAGAWAMKELGMPMGPVIKGKPIPPEGTLWA